MNRFCLMLLLSLLPALAFGQYKQQPTMKESISAPGADMILGFLNSNKFTMNHSFSASFMSFGNNSMMVNSYVNTMHYQFSAPLSLRLNLGLMNTPYTSFNPTPGLNSTQFFGGAELMYQPSDKTTLKLGIDMMPGYNNYRMPYRLTR